MCALRFTDQVTAKFPIASVDYLSGEVPISLSQEVLSPFIPLDSKDSALPCIFFTFTATNPTAAPLTVSIMQSQQNFAAWDGATSLPLPVYRCARP